MPVRIVDLQLIYGTAGAQDQFEKLVTQLVKGEFPLATQIRVSQGDGGIDVYVGKLSDPAGIDVFQAKWFINGLGASQQGQIRKSFRTIRESPAFKAKSWTLCLPVDLTIEETQWFEAWAKKQSGIEIRKPWDGTKLTSLVLDPKHRNLKEEFFKEEQLRLTRETHATVEKLSREFVERVPGIPQFEIDVQFQAVRVERWHDFGPAHVLVEVAFHFHVCNICPQSVSTWKLVMKIDCPDGKFVERDQVRALGPDRMEAAGTPILPTQYAPAKKNLGVVVDRGFVPVNRQLAGIFERTTIEYHGITDNFVGQKKTVKIAEVLDLAQLDEDIWRLGPLPAHHRSWP